ncbi:MAG: glycosyltransferase family 2 protein [Deltaproteobacteria bacterium]|nr:glycosyltransferase family 2 protein [Deltaproteobacteria bacterium]
MKTLSVNVITLNEEKHISACLESLSFADEIVVVDGGSQDKTVELARQYPVKIYENPWPGFGPQRRLAMDKSTGDWILWVDSDERVTPELRAEITSVLQGNDRGKAGFYLPSKNYFSGRLIKHGGWSKDFKLRLFKRDKAVITDRAVHEDVIPDGDLGKLTCPLIHYSYDSISDFVLRMDRYARLSAEEYMQQGRRIGLLGMLFRPLYTFFNMYFMRAGFLDGYHGLVLAGLYAAYTFTKYAKLREKYWNLENPD